MEGENTSICEALRSFVTYHLRIPKVPDQFHVQTALWVWLMDTSLTMTVLLAKSRFSVSGHLGNFSIIRGPTRPTADQVYRKSQSLASTTYCRSQSCALPPLEWFPVCLKLGRNGRQEGHKMWNPLKNIILLPYFHRTPHTKPYIPESAVWAHIRYCVLSHHMRLDSVKQRRHMYVCPSGGVWFQDSHSERL